VEGTTLDKSLIKMETKVFVSVIAAFVIGTNFASIILMDIKANTAKIIYDEGANKRRVSNMKKEIMYEIASERSKVEIERLNKELSKKQR
tara:strand:+ start:10124 stop:10393 length:270 start_codon:yes stop_codon:yes gene_type:complete